MKKVLQISGKMNLGGQETFIMNLYRNINKTKIQFDFIVHGNKKGFYENEIEQMGGTVYHIPPISKGIIRHCIALAKVMQRNNYVAVHRHTATSIVWIDLFVAKLCGIKNTISHSHSTSLDKNKFLHYINRPILNMVTKFKLACSEEAGIFLYGNNKATVIPNGVDVKKFNYSLSKRNKIRKKLNIDNNILVLGHVGRFSYAKNHEFILKIFEKVFNKLEKKCYLILVGDGDLKDKIISDNKNKSFFQNIIFLSQRTDIDELMSAMDIFVFPSFYEGLPLTLIEAQACNLPIIMSNKITDFAIVDDKLIKKERIDSTYLDNWIDYIIRKKDSLEKRKKNNSKILNSEFNIDNTTFKMMSIYGVK